MTQMSDAAYRPSIAGSLPDMAAVPKASFLDTLSVVGGVIIPTLAKGVIIRRPTMVAMADLLDLDRRAIRRMQRLRDKYGSGPLLLRIPGRAFAVVLDPEDVHRVLAESPEPFATATTEKRAALAHFEPKVSLISHGPERAHRRRYNEEVLEANRPVHKLAEAFLEVVSFEAGRLRSTVQRRGVLSWGDFADAWFRLVRRVMFGDAASDDHELSSMMAALRSAGNWAFLRPQNKQLREQLLARIRRYLVQADPNSLAGVMAQVPTSSLTAPEHQVPQWLFAFDPAGMATFRSLALLASHPEHAKRARAEVHSHSGAARSHMPFLRATVLESLRLWPTTPLVLRETTTPTSWRNGVMPARTGLIIFAPFFHRDNERLPYADRFAPELWMDGQTERSPLVPFSDGPAICPGRHLVLLLTTAMLAELMGDSGVKLKAGARLEPDQPLPGTLNHFALRFERNG
jgi:cytochrome P450